MNPHRRVEIEWVDSGRRDGWGDFSEFRRREIRTSPVKTSGYLIGESDEAVVVTLGISFDEFGEVDQHLVELTIPRIAIIEIRELRR